MPIHSQIVALLSMASCEVLNHNPNRGDYDHDHDYDYDVFLSMFAVDTALCCCYVKFIYTKNRLAKEYAV